MCLNTTYLGASSACMCWSRVTGCRWCSAPWHTAGRTKLSGSCNLTYPSSVVILPTVATLCVCLDGCFFFSVPWSRSDSTYEEMNYERITNVSELFWYTSTCTYAQLSLLGYRAYSAVHRLIVGHMFSLSYPVTYPLSLVCLARMKPQYSQPSLLCSKPL